MRVCTIIIITVFLLWETSFNLKCWPEMSRSWKWTCNWNDLKKLEMTESRRIGSRIPESTCEQVEEGYVVAVVVWAAPPRLMCSCPEFHLASICQMETQTQVSDSASVSERPANEKLSLKWKTHLWFTNNETMLWWVENVVIHVVVDLLQSDGRYVFY